MSEDSKGAMGEITLEVLAKIANSNERIAYLLADKDREFADSLIGQAHDIRRYFRNNLEGNKQKIYLTKSGESEES